MNQATGKAYMVDKDAINRGRPQQTRNNIISKILETRQTIWEQAKLDLD